MNELEHQLNYPLGEALPAPGSAIAVAPGVLWVRMRLPFALDHINLWLLRDELDGRPGWTLVDCGLGNEETRSCWEQVFATVLDGLPVLRVIVTHMHPDHVGSADWLTRRWRTDGHDCRLWMSAADFQGAQLGVQSTTGVGGDAAAAHFARHGLLDAHALDKVRARSSYYGQLVPAVPRQYRRLMDGQTLRIAGQDWRCIAGHGHAPEHISLYGGAREILISGDMVLPRISTNVSVVDTEPEADPLALYLRSIDALRALPPDTLVLPSHGRPFRGLHTRIDQLHAHHAQRFAQVMQACAGQPCSAADILPVLFPRPMDLHQTTFALGEAIAHLHALVGQGRLCRVQGADGVLRFSPARA